MTEKELRHLNRKELLEILIDQTKKINLLREKVQGLESELNERKIAITESGSMAEASLKLNGVFAAADKAAQQYLENARMNEAESRRLLEETREKTEAESSRLLEEAREKTEAECSRLSEETREKTEAECRRLLEETREKAKEMLAEAEEIRTARIREADAYLERAKKTVRNFVTKHPEMRSAFDEERKEN